MRVTLGAVCARRADGLRPQRVAAKRACEYFTLLGYGHPLRTGTVHAPGQAGPSAPRFKMACGVRA